MIRFFALIALLAASSYSLDHLYSFRLAGGVSDYVGSDTPPGSDRNIVYSASIQGAENFYPSGPLWGTELIFTRHGSNRDTLVWNESTGNNDLKATLSENFSRLSFGLYLMKSWDFGLALSTGPLASYMASCSREVGSSNSACDDDYDLFQFDAQITMTVFVMEPFAIDIKYIQTLLPFDKGQKDQYLNRIGTIGVLYVF
jgi:hypothetical protein